MGIHLPRYADVSVTSMWEELLNTISDKAYQLESMQKHLVGYVNDATGWDLTVINPWFVERGYEFIGYMDLFSENEPPGIFITVEGLVWRCNTNIVDNQLYWYFETEASEAINLDDMRFVHGWAHQFIWDSDDKKCYIVNIAE
nr:MAG TPA: hypothetical protein [Caudoviricetes sp.]